MTRAFTHGTDIVPREVASLLRDLRARDQETKGTPQFRDAIEADLGRRWLETALTDVDAYAEHLALLKSLSAPTDKQAQSPGLRSLYQCRLLSPDRLEAVLRCGPSDQGALPDDTLAPLLINPFALDDLANHIHE